MKEEDLDWAVYHYIAADPTRDPEKLAECLRCPVDDIQSSLERLERAFLIERGKEGKIRVLSVHEMLIRCQAKYRKDFPFVVEGGVIRVKGDPGPEK